MNIGMGGGFNMNNVNTHNTISMMSSMTGVPTRHAVSNNKEQGQVDKTQNRNVSESDNDSGEVSEQEESPKSSKAKGGRASQAGQSQAKQQTNGAQQRRIADNASQQKAQENSEASSANKADKSEQASKPAKPSPTTFDTSRAIQLKFTKEQQAQPEAPKRPDVARKEFADNLKKWVNLEYKQYTKDVSLYTCRDMRSIMSALTDTSSKTNKTSSKEDKTGRNQVSFSKFNKYNITSAANALRIFEEIPSPEDNLNFNLVA